MHRKISLTILLCAGAGAVFAQTRGGDLQLTKISRSLIATPDYTYNGAETFRTNTRDRWLEVEVDFTAVAPFTEEMTLKYYILLNGKLLTGEVAHVNVLAGKDQHSVMYIPPQALAYLMAKRPLTANSVENIAVQVVRQGVVKDELSLNRARPQWYSALTAVPGFVLNKNETPFAPLYWDHYAQVKPAGAR